MTLGKRIQNLRKAAGLSQDALGERLGVTRQAVSRWEADGTVPEVDNLIAMARLFGVTVDELLCGARSPEEEPAPVETDPEEETPETPPATPALWARRPDWVARRPAAFWGMVGALAVCAVLAVSVMTQNWTIRQLREQRASDAAEIDRLQQKVSDQAWTIEELREQQTPAPPVEENLLLDWDIAVLGPDVESGGTRYGLSAQLNTLKEGAQVSFILDGGPEHTVELPVQPDAVNRCTAEVVLAATEDGYMVRLAEEEDGHRRLETLPGLPICAAPWESGDTVHITINEQKRMVRAQAEEKLDGREAWLVEGAVAVEIPVCQRGGEPFSPFAVPQSGEIQLLREDEVVETIPVELTMAQNGEGAWVAAGSAELDSRVELPDPGKQFLEVDLTARFAYTDQFGTTRYGDLFRSRARLSGNYLKQTCLDRIWTFPTE